MKQLLHKQKGLLPTILKALTWSKSVNYAQTNKTDLHFELFFVIIP